MIVKVTSKVKVEHTLTKEKKAWGEGPWTKEPDRVEWRDEVTGYRCLIVRNPHLGHWCGYVEIRWISKYMEI